MSSTPVPICGDPILCLDRYSYSKPPLPWSRARGPGPPLIGVSQCIAHPAGVATLICGPVVVPFVVADRLGHRLPCSDNFFSPHLQAPSPLVPHPPPPQPPPPSSQQSSQQQSSGPAASSPLVASPALTSVPLTAAGSLPPPLPVPPQPVSPAGAHLVPPLPAQSLVAADPLSEPPQRQHPLVSLDPAPVARFPLPRPCAESPPLPPDAPDPEDDEKWWNGELWESPPLSGTTWGRDWDMKSDFVLDVLRWERRMIGVGECLSHVATALEQLDAGLEARNFVLRDPQLTEQQQGVAREAAAQGLWRLLRLPLESEHPDENEGPGARAFRRVATAAEEAPLQLVPALASLLRWIRQRFYVLNHV
ncbi:unnamed protein product [Closterium sp. Naga37s-1]|nr:unnamed protein product [Closterium sp. Naga37s-1]